MLKNTIVELENTVELVNKVRKGETAKFDAPDGSEIEISESDLLISLKNKEGFASDSNGEITVVLDSALDERLLELGFIAEFVSKVQNLRKDSGFEVVNHIAIEVDGDEKLVSILNENKDTFTKTLLADSFKQGNTGDFNATVSFDNKNLTVYIRKV